MLAPAVVQANCSLRGDEELCCRRGSCCFKVSYLEGSVCVHLEEVAWSTLEQGSCLGTPDPPEHDVPQRD